MLYWLFTDGRIALQSLLAPLLCLTLVVPLITAALLGVGIQRSHDDEALSHLQRLARWMTYNCVLLGVTALYLTLFGEMAVQTARRR